MNKMVKNFKKPELFSHYEMYHKNGSWMCNCNKKRAEWYIKKNLAKWIGVKKFQLQFEPGGFGKNGKGDFYKEKIKNECVVCGAISNLTKHHVVPYVFIKYFPLEYKGNDYHDLVVICHTCHVEYEVKAEYLKVQFAKFFGVLPDFCDSTINVFDKLNRKIIAARITLKEHESGKIRIPEKNLSKLIAFAEMELFDVEAIESNSWAKLLVGKLIAGGGLYDFMVQWRKHFIEYAKPENMPKHWDVFHKTVEEF
jgi:hypothetical protein